MHRNTAMIVALAVGLITPLAGQPHEEVDPSEAPVLGAPAPAGPLWTAPTGTVLYDNGPLITHPGGGCGGSGDASRVQNVSLGMTTLGANQSAPTFRISDDFTVPAPGWQLSDLTHFGYQTGSGTTSTMTAVNYVIWDGPPNDTGSSVVCGDTAVNCMTATAFTGIFRDSETTMDCARPIMAQTCDASACTLAPGTYWLDWQASGSVASGPWQPPVTILGQTTTGNALQLTGTGWQSFNDTATGTPQGAPFLIEGTPLQVADLAIDKSCDSGPLGGTATCTLTVTNLGPDDATGVTVIDTLPAGVSWVSDTCGAGPPVGQDLTWVIGNLAASASAQCTLVLEAVDPDDPGPFTNTAGVFGDGIDPDQGNDVAQATFGFDEPVPVVSVLEIPTLGQWGAGLLVLLLLAGGMLVIGRRLVG
jgi:uncharacterized repeat protein (TIGR01451 family)